MESGDSDKVRLIALVYELPGDASLSQAESGWEDAERLGRLPTPVSRT